MISSRWSPGRLRLSSITSQSTRCHHYQSFATTRRARQTPPICRLQKFPPTRRLHTPPGNPSEILQESKLQKLAAKFLPISCPGCGAFTQWVDSDQPGFYSAERNHVKAFLREVAPPPTQDNSIVIDSQADEVQNVAATESTEGGKKKDNSPRSEGMWMHHPLLVYHDSNPSLLFNIVKDTENEAQPPFCDRCHNLLNHGTASPIHSPSIHSVRDIITDAPFGHNHVYHILDAADFPLSLIPNIYRDLDLQKQRSKNRRSKVVEFEGSARRSDIHFVITRADLLAPTKEQVDSLMAPITQVLRTALSTGGRDIRMGNVHLVSAHRGWWTKHVKDKIWEHGGAVWLVGKTNVGKSNLLDSIFPKATSDPVARSKTARGNQISGKTESFGGQTIIKPEKMLDEADISDADSLLPPAQRESRFPVLPIVSSLAGTTASPIRIPFGERKGELIDLPGLSRGGLEEFALEEHKQDLIMKKRAKPERITVKPGKSLLLGGLIRITPTNPDDIVFAASFTPILPHLTSTEKAVGVQIQERVANIPTVAKENIGHTIMSAGVFVLKWDVTDIYTKKKPQSNRREVEEKKPYFPQLYKILATDILIEGVGWVELSAQVRTKGFEDREFPKVEVFSPGGKFVGTRMPLNAWTFIKPKPKAWKRSTTNFRKRQTRP